MAAATTEMMTTTTRLMATASAKVEAIATRLREVLLAALAAAAMLQPRAVSDRVSVMRWHS